MEVKQINDSTIKITIQLEDLEEHGMEIADFLVPQEKTEEFFYTILDELEMPESFLDSGMLSFRVTPKPDKLDVFVTRSKIDKNLNFEDLGNLPDMDELSQMSPDEFLKTLEKNIFEKSKDDLEAVKSLEAAEADQEDSADSSEEKEEENLDRYVYYILSFADLRSVISFAKTVDYPIDLSELYKYDSAYYLTILVDLEEQPALYPAWLLAKMREFAEDTDITRSVLQEHGRLLLVTEAIQQLQKVECL